MRKIKKLLALAIAAVMAVSVMSMSASATDPAPVTDSVITQGSVIYWRPELRDAMGTSNGWSLASYSSAYIEYTDYCDLGGANYVVRMTPDVEAYYRNGGTFYVSNKANYGTIVMFGGVAEMSLCNDDLFKNLVIGGTDPAGTSTARYFGARCFENSALETIVFESVWDPDVTRQAMYFDGREQPWKILYADVTSAGLNNFCLGIDGFIIADYAFANCKNLTSVIFQTEPALYIGSGAFTGCPNLTITAPVGGAIEAHCIENGIKFVPYTDANGNVVQANNRLFTNGAYPDTSYIRIAGGYSYPQASYIDPRERLAEGYVYWPCDPNNYTPNPVMSGNYVFNRDSDTESAAPAGSFSDVKTSDWYYDAVEWAAANKIVTGDGSGGFNPAGSLQRCELAQVLYNMVGQPSVVGLNNPFSDVKTSDWYYNPVIWCASKGIINGNGDGSFSPMGTCTKSALTQVIYNAFGTPDITGLSNPFSDVYASDWYLKPVIWCASKGIVNGSENGTFQPNGTCQRAALAQVMYNMNQNGITLPL